MGTQPPAAPVIDVVNLTQHYGIRPVLSDINLRVDRPEVLALMGPNGMGKSTLMAVMAGVLPASAGHVAINGLRRRSTEEAELTIRKSVVYVPADAWLPLMRSGRAWLLAVGRLWGHEPLALMDHADRLFDLFELAGVQDSVAASYSTGQKRKLILAGALITQAPIMLLDEPFGGGLDPSAITALKRVLQRLRDDHKATIVMATPVPELVEDLADRIAVLRGGKMVALDTLEGLRRQSGCAGRLEEVYEKLFSPQTAQNVDRYFAGGTS